MTLRHLSRWAAASMLLLAIREAGAATDPPTSASALPAAAAAPSDLRQPAPSGARTRPAAAPDAAFVPVGAEQGWSSDDSSREVDTRWSVAPILGFSSNGLNAGLGLRAGKTLANRIYIGGTFVYNVGESTTYFPYATYPYYYGTAYAGAAASASSSLFYTGPEGGYDFSLKYVVIRAYVGLGIVHTSVSYSATTLVPTPVQGAVVTGSTSATAFGLWPGAAVLYGIPHSVFFVGGDLRLLIPAGGGLAQGISSDPAVGFFAFGGAKFGS
jgi:hypothetical protein